MMRFIKNWEKGDRIVINYGENGNYLGTVTMFEDGKITILFDDGDGETLPLRSRHIVGQGIKRKRKKPIADANLKKYLVNSTKQSVNVISQPVT